MYVQAIKKITGSIFPIFFRKKEGETTTTGVLGTGFFIDDKGHFLTAEHVIASAPEGSKLVFVGNIPDAVTDLIEISEVFRDSVRDIYLGKIDKNFLPPVKTIFEKPEIGKSVCLCGYPLSKLSLNPNGTINIDNVRKYWQPTFVIDTIKNMQFQDKRYAGFMTQNPILQGMSGGPVFDIEGNVYGVSVFIYKREIQDKNVPITVHNGIVVGLDTIKDIFEKIE